MDIREKLVELFYDNNMICNQKIEGLTDDVMDIIAHGVKVQELDGCKYCKEYEDLPEHFIDSKPVGRVFDTCIQRNENGLWHLEVPYGVDIGIRFCPMCGGELLQQPAEENDYD